MAIEQTKLAKLMRLLGSPVDHEAHAALGRLNRLMSSAGIDWGDIVNKLGWDAAVEQWREMAGELAENAELSDKEQSFIDSLRRWRGQPSEKQLDWLMTLWEQYQEGIR